MLILIRFRRIILSKGVIKIGNLGNKEIMARNITRYMDLKGVDRNKLSDDLGISYTTITDWVKAKTYPRIDKIEMMANYFGINKSDLVENKIDLEDVRYHDVYESINNLMDKDSTKCINIINNLSKLGADELDLVDNMISTLIGLKKKDN